MRLNEDQQQRIQLLSTTLEELRRQRKELDAREIAVRSERNALLNLASPTSDLPAEVLAMVFEAGVRQANDSNLFGIPVSHVSQRWRNVALATPGLWIKIWCVRIRRASEFKLHQLPNGEREKDRERAATFLSRTKFLPVDISIFLFRDEDFSPEFLELIGEHMGHCRQLRIKDADCRSLPMALGYLSTKSAPRLSSIDLSSSDDILLFAHPLFPLACLTAVQLDCIDLSLLHQCIPAFRSVTSMRLTRLYIDEDEYDPFREGLMAMKSLTHLELHFEWFRNFPSRLLVVLPTLHFLLVDNIHNPSSIITFIQNIRAPCVRTLSLTGWDAAEQPEFSDTMDIGDHFPSLQHLILNGISKPIPNLDLIARIFPDIERLTCQVVQPDPRSSRDPCGIDHIVAVVVPLTSTAEDGGNNDSQTSRRWHSLKSIAMSAEEPLNAMALEDMLHKLKGVGHPLRELMLSEAVFSQAGREAMGQLGQLVDIKGFHVDWPTPFACRACGSHLRLLGPTCRENCIYSDMGGMNAAFRPKSMHYLPTRMVTDGGRHKTIAMKRAQVKEWGVGVARYCKVLSTRTRLIIVNELLSEGEGLVSAARPDFATLAVEILEVCAGLGYQPVQHS
ncbi:hypothetical protein FIBSPDRAFT_1006366 [Athelia psychrophila]|uniref:Uncharacterized protein n=1 Tax=Athelia psychrophila TaxID=1759441 RepID=A0A167VJR7_9AGAM|nr:hypothetical protein FIBSPDRAFT_1006366 [Fibularhizoctonia sp. CBS 109695]